MTHQMYLDLLIHLAQLDVERGPELLLELLGVALGRPGLGGEVDSSHRTAAHLLPEEPDSQPDGQAHALQAEGSPLALVREPVDLPKNILQIAQLISCLGH